MKCIKEVTEVIGQRFLAPIDSLDYVEGGVFQGSCPIFSFYAAA